MIILVEGLDGSGKSTLCQRLSGSFPNSTVWHAQPPPPNVNTPWAVRNWYEFQCATVSSSNNDVLILDRWWPTTLAFTNAYYSTPVQQLAEVWCRQAPIPDYVFSLVCNQTIAKQRIEKRDGVASQEESRLHTDQEFKGAVVKSLKTCLSQLHKNGAKVFKVMSQFSAPTDIHDAVMSAIRGEFSHVKNALVLPFC